MKAAKQQLVEMLKCTPIGQSYTFDFEGSRERAESYVHTMRTHLSRLRKRAIDAGFKRKEFKINIELIEEITTPANTLKKVCKVTLKRTVTGMEVDDLLDELENELTRGEKQPNV